MVEQIRYVAEWYGHGPCVVLIPSLGRPGADYDDLASRLNVAGFSTIVLSPVIRDVPDASPFGAGDYDIRRTIWPITGEHGQTFEDLADVVAAIAHETGGEPVHVIGHAYGQALARCAVTRHPGLARSLVLLACGRGLASDELNISVRACFDSDFTKADRDIHLSHVARAFFAPGNDPAVWADGWLSDVAALQMEALLHTHPTWRTATFAPTPVLLVQGLQDALAPPGDGRHYAAEHPNVKLVEIDGAGHALLPERPDEVAEACLAFLRQVAEGMK
jgi:pimeloyl-ACP methyl ester carboxylesterase